MTKGNSLRPRETQKTYTLNENSRNEAPLNGGAFVIDEFSSLAFVYYGITFVPVESIIKQCKKKRGGKNYEKSFLHYHQCIICCVCLFTDVESDF
jgi:hypothetical protein